MPAPFTAAQMLDDLKTEVAAAGETTDDALLTRYLANAWSSIGLVTSRTFAAVSKTDAVIRGADVLWGADGVLRVRVGTPRLVAVTALAYRLGTPATAWTAVDLSLVDYDPDDIQRDTLAAYLPPPGPTSVPLWARVSYAAGWTGADDDPYPPDLYELVLWWAGWLYRTKDAPFDKTANPLTGSVTVPSSLPARLKPVVTRWKWIPVV